MADNFSQSTTPTGHSLTTRELAIALLKLPGEALDLPLAFDLEGRDLIGIHEVDFAHGDGGVRLVSHDFDYFLDERSENRLFHAVVSAHDELLRVSGESLPTDGKIRDSLIESYVEEARKFLALALKLLSERTGVIVPTTNPHSPLRGRGIDNSRPLLYLTH